jgi:hypothetical protein
MNFRILKWFWEHGMELWRHPPGSSAAAISRTVRPINVTLVGVPLKGDRRVTGAHEGPGDKVCTHFCFRYRMEMTGQLHAYVALLHVEQPLVLTAT